jgi:hypothetical protein
MIGSALGGVFGAIILAAQERRLGFAQASTGVFLHDNITVRVQSQTGK